MLIAHDQMFFIVTQKQMPGDLVSACNMVRYLTGLNQLIGSDD